MAVYAISYDLHGEPPSIYDALIEALEQAGAQHAQGSVWFLSSPYSAEENYNWFKRHFQPDDELMVLQVVTGNVWATRNSKSISAITAAVATERQS
jgi:hypothetical protein